MKKIFLTMSMLAMSAMIWAIPAKRGIWKTVKLADGTEVRVELRGDEHCSFWQAENGMKYVRQSDAEYFVEADMASLNEQAVTGRSKSPLRSPQKVSIGDSNHPAFVGSKKGLIILVNFKDRKFLPEHDATYYTHLANDLNFSSSDGHRGSIRDYFLAQSEGQFDLTFDVAGPIELQYNMTYYGGHSSMGASDKNAAAMISEAVRGAASQLGSMADYDWFDDGYVDQVFVLYAGYGEATGGGDNTIWPHRSSISTITVGGKKVSVYACSNELNTDDTPCGIGTFCHEFSHCLGLPDLYDTSYGGNYGMGAWDIMNSGCYNGGGYRPCGYSGYERNFCGWRAPKYLTENTHVESLKGLTEGGDYYVIKNDAHEDEYYILENRTQTGWDSDLYGSGLIITHIDYNKQLWEWNMVNTTGSNGWISNDHERYALFLADNSTTEVYVADVAGDAYPYKTNNALADYTVPAAILYNPNKNGSMFMNKPVTNITRNGDNTISFDFADESNVEREPLPEGVLFLETFDKCTGTGGNDNIWSGSSTVANGYFITDNEGWNSLYKFGANKSARFGTNAQRGVATTPDIEINGTKGLSFLAAPWTGEATTLTLQVAEGTATLGETSFKLTNGKWTTCTTDITGEGKVKIQFRSNRGRFFLDEVMVAEPDVTAITDITFDSPANASSTAVYSLDGRYLGNDLDALDKGMYIVNGKKTVKTVK